MPKTFCSNAGIPGSFTNALSYDEQIQYLVNKYNEMADVINNLKIDADISDVVKYIPQTGFSELQKQQATENIRAVSTIKNQILDEDEQMNARENINAMKYEPKDDFVKAGGAVVYDENFTNILPNTNLATVAYCEPGRYYCEDITGITGFSAAMPFEMEVFKVNSNLVRRYFQYDNGRKYVQEVELNPLKFYSVVDFGGFNVSYLLQDLTEDQKAQARENIGAGTGSGSAENAVLYTPQTLTDSQKGQVRENIDLNIVTTNEETVANFTNLVNTYGITSNSQLTTTGSTTDGTTVVTGFIPFTKGDIIRIKDENAISLNPIYAVYDENKTVNTNVIGRYLNNMIADENNAYGTFTNNNNIITWDTNTISYWFWNNATYIRLTLSSPDVIVTKNEEIVYTTKNKITINKDNLPNIKPLNNYNGVVLGDSIFGMNRDETSVTNYAEETSGAKIENCGFGGTRISAHNTQGYSAFSGYALANAITSANWISQDAQASLGQDYFPDQLNKLKNINFNNIDFLILHYGTNDFSGNVEIDNSNNNVDTNTVCGSLRYTLNKFLTSFPKLQIFISLPLYRKFNNVDSNTYKNTLGKTLLEYNTAIETVAYNYNCPVINGYKTLGINSINASTFLTDGTHLTLAGRKIFGIFIGENLYRATAGTNISDATANCVLTTAQTLTDTQKEQARNNIGASSLVEENINITANGQYVSTANTTIKCKKIGNIAFVSFSLKFNNIPSNNTSILYSNLPTPLAELKFTAVGHDLTDRTTLEFYLKTDGTITFNPTDAIVTSTTKYNATLSYVIAE